MVQQRSRKTVRHFQCRDDLWALYEKMAAELECSVDYLINESMRQYARARRSGTIPPTRDSIAPPGRPSMPGAPIGRPSGGLAPPPPGGGGIAAPPSGQRLAPPPGPRPGAPAPAPAARPAAPAPPLATTQPMTPPTMDTDPNAQIQPPAQARPQPVAQPAPVATAGTMPTLYLIFNGQKIPITKEQFIIGRGLKTSDLAIKDGNISRKHAAVIYHNGAYYIKDLGSVNGIEYGGKRIDSKRIDENDQFHICDYEMRFTYN